MIGVPEENFAGRFGPGELLAQRRHQITEHPDGRLGRRSFPPAGESDLIAGIAGQRLCIFGRRRRPAAASSAARTRASTPSPVTPLCETTPTDEPTIAITVSWS